MSIFKCRFYGTQTNPLLRTPLFKLHKANNAKLVPFAEWEMPLLYGNVGILDSHLFTRSSASLFDVSHMMQSKIYGRDRIRFIESLTVGDFADLPPNKAQLTLFTNASGGILDDAMIQKIGDYLLVVSNAGTATKMRKHLQESLQLFQGEAEVETMVQGQHQEYSMIAIQGPKSSFVLASILQNNLDDWLFLEGRSVTINNVPCYATRSGYTGEDGFEIIIPSKNIETITSLLLSFPELQLCGLGARDSLRLEAGLCLYGHDITEKTTPVEAGLSWTIGREARNRGGFLGFDTILHQLSEGSKIRRVGLIVDKVPAREGAKILNMEGTEIGYVTSGGPSPSLNKNIAMGYVTFGQHKLGTNLLVEVRKNTVPAVITKLPFWSAKYHRVSTPSLANTHSDNNNLQWVKAASTA